MEVGRALSLWSLLPIPLVFGHNISITDFRLGSHSLFKWRIYESIRIGIGPNSARDILAIIKEHECPTGEANGSSTGKKPSWLAFESIA